MRLIDADKLSKEIVNTPTRYEDDGIDARCGIACRQNEILDIIDRQPIVAQWHKLIFIPLTEGEKESYDYEGLSDFIEGLPEYGEEVLVTNGTNVWIDSFDEDGYGVWLSGTDDNIDGVIAWMEIPPYKEQK